MYPPVIRALLIDISGTLLIGSSPIPGAGKALAALRDAHVPFRLCSNTSKESSNAVHERMREAGLDVRREELWTSVGVLRTVLKQLDVKRPYMLLSRSALEECTDEVIHGDSPSSISYDGVVVGLAPSLLDYAHLDTAFRILIGENRPRDTLVSDPTSTSVQGSDIKPQVRPPLIALHKARYLEAPDHALSLGPGPFVHALEDAAQTTAKVVGKPTRAFFEAVLRDLERDLDVDAPSQCDEHQDQDQLSSHSRRWEGIAVIGDDVRADLGEGAIELGLWRVLVKTGKYRPGDEGRKDTMPPDQVSTSFAEFVEALVEGRRG